MTANETTDHAWVREHVATYLAGGLADDERARFETHVGTCGSCLEELQDAQGTERSLASLFAGDRPPPWLEDRIITSLRERPAPRRGFSSSFLRIGSAVAAVLLIGLVGLLFEAERPAPSVAKMHFSAPPAPPRDSGGFVGGFVNATSQSTRLAEGRDFAKAQVGATLPGAAEMARNKTAELLDRDRAETRRHAEISPGFSTAPGSELRKNVEERARGGAYKDGVEKKPDDHRFDSDRESFAGERRADVERFEAEKSKDVLKGDWYFKPGADSKAELERKSRVIPPKGPAADGDKGPAQQPVAKSAQEPQAPPVVQRKIIRQGELEFEVDGFDSAVDKVTRIVAEESGYVATVNSDRLANGKVKGTIILRVPPDNLDRLVLKLRALGELKSQRITSEDVTKRYTDLEGQLRAARTMEGRLIEIIKSGKGEIKDILAAEKELGQWREKIELFEGELRYYANLVSLSTLTLTLLEKDIKAPSLVTVTETVDTGIEADDVLKADKDVRAMIAELKGRITASDLKKLAAEQFSLSIACEVPPENAGPLRDRLSQLGRVARLDVQTQTSDDGRGRPLDAKVKRNDTVFRISVYNTTNVQPRETNHLNLACGDVEAAYDKVIKSVAAAGGRVVQSNLNRVKADQVDGLVHFDVPADKGGAVLDGIKLLGEVMSYKVVENPDTVNVTKSKRGFSVVLLAVGHVGARETTTIRFAARDVAATQRGLQALVLEKSGRVLDARLNEESRDNVTATLDVELPRGERAAFDDALKAAGEILSQNVQRAADDGRVVDSKIRLTLSLQTVASVGPRRIVRLGVEVADVDGAAEKISAFAASAGGQVVDSQNSRDPNGRAVSVLSIEAPLNVLAGLVDQIRKTGTVRVEETRRNPSAPETPLAIGRVDLTLSNPDPLMGGDAGIGAQFKDGLRGVIAAAGFSLKVILIGALIIVPWALIVGLGVKLVRRRKAKAAAGV